MNSYIDPRYKTGLKVLLCSPSILRLYTGLYDVQRNLALGSNRNRTDLCIYGLRDRYTLKDANLWKPVSPYVHDISKGKNFRVAKVIKDLFN